MVGTPSALLSNTRCLFSACASYSLPRLVISMFATWWLIGIALLAIGRWSKGEKSKIHVDMTTKKTATTALNVHQDFNAYIDVVMPLIFRGETSFWKNIKKLLGHHQYATLVQTEKLCTNRLG